MNMKLHVRGNLRRRDLVCSQMWALLVLCCHDILFLGASYNLHRGCGEAHAICTVCAHELIAHAIYTVDIVGTCQRMCNGGVLLFPAPQTVATTKPNG